MTTMLLAISFGTMLLLSLLLWIVFFWLGARWAGIARVTFLRATLAGLAVGVAMCALGTIVIIWLASAGAGHELLPRGLDFVGGVVVSLLVLKAMFRAPLGRLFLAWLPTLIGGVIVVLLTLFIFRPLVYETFIVSTNSMAPTLMGPHWVGTCPRCGAKAYASGPRGAMHGESRELQLTMMCSRELRSCVVDQPAPDPRPQDRFLVSKLIPPRRWDVIAFDVPEDPKTRYVKRVVGMPGETVVIRDGAVWIDGQKQTPPAPIAALQYETDPTLPLPHLWGDPQHPARLGPDEYFVVGDFSIRSSDSRLWQAGAPGHPAYAVPRSYVVGVVTHIYWPPSRWRILR